ncbi:unnamed protein product [Rodentolepis nana]|uniref:Uncharacterized protein n=1 Tax=Rodentolepis nana TaxID=102285 RepID=A0A0R3TUX2_RODNA|nr:unnamed protein product [Rodentolepis nana]
MKHPSVERRRKEMYYGKRNEVIWREPHVREVWRFESTWLNEAEGSSPKRPDELLASNLIQSIVIVGRKKAFRRSN